MSDSCTHRSCLLVRCVSKLSVSVGMLLTFNKYVLNQLYSFPNGMLILIKIAIAFESSTC